MTRLCPAFLWLAAILVAGCMKPSSEVENTVPSIFQVNLDLSSFPEGADVVFQKILVDESSKLTLEASSTFPTNTLNPACSFLGFEGRRIAAMGKPPDRKLAASFISREPIFSQSGLAGGEFNETFSDAVEFLGPGETVVAFAFDNPPSWNAVGARFSLNVTGTRPFKVESPINGSMICINQPSDFQSGEFTILPSGASAQNLRLDFRIVNQGKLWFLPQANLGYAFVVSSTNGTVIEDTHGPNEPMVSYIEYLPKGEYTIMVSYMRGTEIHPTMMIVDVDGTI
jgi:hypothetical protein